MATASRESSEPTMEMELDNPFGSPDEHPLPVGDSPRGVLSENKKTGRSRLSASQKKIQSLLKLPGAEANEEIPTGASFSEAGTPKKTGDPKATAKIVVGLVGVGLALGAWVVARQGRKLRKPTKQQINDFARPVGAILARHTDLSWLGNDIEDLGQAAAVVTDYASEGPIAPKVNPVEHVGMEKVQPPEPPVHSVPVVESYTTVPSPANVTYLQ